MLMTCRKGLLKTFWLCGLALLSSQVLAEDTKPGRTDRTQQAIAASGDSVARWIDAFFDDPSVEEEEAESRLELRQSSTSSEQDSNEYRVRVSARLKLRNLSRRLSLTFAGNADEEELVDGAAHVFDDAEEDSLDDPTLGLQYIFHENNGYHGSFSVGTRLNNPSVNLGPRFRYQHQLSKNWRGRYTERFLWDTDDGWESRTALEFDRPIASGNLFRQSVRADWRESREDTQGVRYHPLLHSKKNTTGTLTRASACLWTFCSCKTSRLPS